MSKGWRHNICLLCWDQQNPTKQPYRVLDQSNAPDETCCYCGRTNRDGIYIRQNPNIKELICHGEHDR